MLWTHQKGLRVKELLHWKFKVYSSLLNLLMCLPPLSPLLHLLNSFLRLFYTWFFDPTLLQYFCMLCLKLSPCVVVIVCLNEFDDWPVIQIYFNDYIYAYHSLLKMDMMWWKKNTPPFLTKINYLKNEFIWLFRSRKNYLVEYTMWIFEVKSHILDTVFLSVLAWYKL